MPLIAAVEVGSGSSTELPSNRALALALDRPVDRSPQPHPPPVSIDSHRTERRVGGAEHQLLTARCHGRHDVFGVLAVASLI